MRMSSSIPLIVLSSALLFSAPSSAGPASPSGWTDGYVMANGIRLHYWRTGGDKPPLVMAHGSSDDGLCWTNLAKEFQDRYDIIMFDARGHGLSDPPTPSDPADVQVEDLAGLITALKLEKPILMGHSMGSASVAHFAAKYPDVPRAVVLEDPALVRACDAARRRRFGAAHTGATTGESPRAQQPDGSGARRPVHEELAEVGAVRMRVLGAVEAPASPGHDSAHASREAADARAVSEDRRANADSQGRRSGRSAGPERSRHAPAAKGQDRSHRRRGTQRAA